MWGYLKELGRWPLSDYFRYDAATEEVRQKFQMSEKAVFADRVSAMPEDDDTNYTMLALALVEQHGSDFSTDDVARLWLAELPASRVFTAERVAYRNLLEGLEAPETATVCNPYREWIGAQIRTDLYGWVRPGDPRWAAELAWRDARLSHTRNGIYGAMFTAAMGSAAMVATEVSTVVAAGLAVVPPQSRLAGAVRLALEVAEEEPDTERGLDRLYAAYGDLHWVHSVNNAALVAYGLRVGDGDFTRSICVTVTGGWDTDSNGATVGGVAGALTGAGMLPARWTGPLRNRVASSIRGFDGIGFDDLARRTRAMATNLAGRP